MVGVVLVCGLVVWLFLGAASDVFSGTDCLELRVVVCMCWILRVLAVGWFMFTLIVLVRFVLLPFM